MANKFDLLKKCILVGVSLLSFNLMSTSASAHWATQEHPTMWPNVTHGVAHRQIYQTQRHRKPYSIKNTRYPTRKNYPFKDFWRHVKTFKHPMLGKHALDYCYKRGKFCGRAAANAFCKRRGYKYASQFKQDRHAKMTRNIGDRHINRYAPNRGKGFTYIRCRKHA